MGCAEGLGTLLNASAHGAPTPTQGRLCGAKAMNSPCCARWSRSLQTTRPTQNGALGGGWGVPGDGPASLQWLRREALALSKGTGQLAPWGRSVTAWTGSSMCWPVGTRSQESTDLASRGQETLETKVQWRGEKKMSFLGPQPGRETTSKGNVQRTFLVKSGVGSGRPVSARGCLAVLGAARDTAGVESRHSCSGAAGWAEGVHIGGRTAAGHASRHCRSIEQTAPDVVPGLACGQAQRLDFLWGPRHRCVGVVLCRATAGADCKRLFLLPELD